MSTTKYRHEWKHELSPAQLPGLRTRLSAVMRLDPHASGGSYVIRSLYFDSPQDKALREKLDGVSRREKFRLRCYNADTQHVTLEKKLKRGNLCAKLQQRLTGPEALALSVDARLPDCQGLLEELRVKMTLEGLAPKTIVEYTREPFIYAPGNVRVTLDYNIRMSPDCAAFLTPGGPTVPARDGPVILEVKWDGFLPDVIRDIVQTPGVRTGSFSKYAACRVFG